MFHVENILLNNLRRNMCVKASKELATGCILLIFVYHPIVPTLLPAYFSSDATDRLLTLYVSPLFSNRSTIPLNRPSGGEEFYRTRT